MKTIIVVTDFSQSAQNAFSYACAFTAASDKIALLLVNINAVPASYSGEGVSMAAIGDTLEDRIDRLEDEIERVKQNFPAATITHKAMVGGYIKTLKALIDEEEAVMIIMGTPASYGEVFSWDTDNLQAMTELPIPVLSVPKDAVYRPIKQLAFASIPGNLHKISPIESIRKLVNYTGAQLHIVSVVLPQHDEEKDRDATLALQQQLEGINTAYHTINNPHVVQAIGQFVEENNIDLLIVRPRKHGIWYNLFNKSYAKELAKLNLIPVIALHDEWNVD
ncbi:MAG: universal stress protein [Chitinophagaceae bacterium]